MAVGLDLDLGLCFLSLGLLKQGKKSAGLTSYASVARVNGATCKLAIMSQSPPSENTMGKNLAPSLQSNEFALLINQGCAMLGGQKLNFCFH